MEDLLNQICKIYVDPINHEKYGKVTWGNFTTIPCRFAKTSRHYKNSQGNEVNITAKLWVSSSSNFADIGTKIEYKDKAYIIIDYKEWVDEYGEVFGWLYYCDNYPAF